MSLVNLNASHLTRRRGALVNLFFSNISGLKENIMYNYREPCHMDSDWTCFQTQDTRQEGRN